MGLPICSLVHTITLLVVSSLSHPHCLAFPHDHNADTISVDGANEFLNQESHLYFTQAPNAFVSLSQAEYPYPQLADDLTACNVQFTLADFQAGVECPATPFNNVSNKRPLTFDEDEQDSYGVSGRIKRRYGVQEASFTLIPVLTLILTLLHSRLRFALA